MIKGILTPIGSINATDSLAHVVRSGITSGYQTMDMMGSAVFAMAIVFELTQKGYTKASDQFKVISLSGMVCGALLFIVYGGLAFLGATTAGNYSAGLSQTVLLSTITRELLGHPGLVVLAIIVASACITTAVGLLTSVSAFFEDLTGGRISYKTFVVIFTLFSWIISNFGIATIISVAAPILEILFPVLITLTVLRLFASRIHDNYVYFAATAVTVAVSFLSTLGSLLGVSLGVDKLPLADMGFEWLIPAILVTAVTLIISAAHQKQ